MKKVISLTLALMMGLSLVACSNSEVTTEEPEMQEEEVKEVNSFLEICNLKADDFKVVDGVTLANIADLPKSYDVNVYLGTNSFDDYSKYVYAFAEKCKSVSLDGKLYKDEFDWEEAEINLDPNSILNSCQFLYKVPGHTIYANIDQTVNEDKRIDVVLFIF